MSGRDILDGVFTNLIHDIDGSRAALAARRELTLAASELEPGDPTFVGPDGATLGAQAMALRTLANHLMIAARNRARERAAQYGWNVATHVIAPIAQDASNTTPVVWITGNAYMPPLRDVSDAGRLWDALDANTDQGGELWALFVERLESRLIELNVHMDAPEYDNALYVVDLARFEHLDEDELAELEQRTASAPGELTLNDEWRPVQDA